MRIDLFKHIAMTGDRVQPAPPDPDVVASVPGLYEDDASFLRAAMVKMKWQKPTRLEAEPKRVKGLRSRIRWIREEIAILERRLGSGK